MPKKVTTVLPIQFVRDVGRLVLFFKGSRLTVRIPPHRLRAVVRIVWCVVLLAPTGSVPHALRF